MLTSWPAGGASFVASERHGIWRKAQELRASAAVGTQLSIYFIACTSPGNCAAGGTYDGPDATEQVFVASEAAGKWGVAEPLPGLAALNKGGSATLGALSCGGPESCSAAGAYTDKYGNTQVFVATER